MGSSILKFLLGEELAKSAFLVEKRKAPTNSNAGTFYYIFPASTDNLKNLIESKLSENSIHYWLVGSLTINIVFEEFEMVFNFVSDYKERVLATKLVQQITKTDSSQELFNRCLSVLKES
jgi:hypothetical protein